MILHRPLNPLKMKFEREKKRENEKEKKANLRNEIEEKYTDGNWRKVMITMLQMSSDGNTTTSILSFMATKTDAGRQLSCKAENPIMGSESIRDDWVLEIQCKRIKDTLWRDQLSISYDYSPPEPTDILTFSICRHAGNADTAGHLVESQRDPRGNWRVLRLFDSRRAPGL